MPLSLCPGGLGHAVPCEVALCLPRVCRLCPPVSQLCGSASGNEQPRLAERGITPQLEAEPRMRPSGEAPPSTVGVARSRTTDRT